MTDITALIAEVSALSKASCGDGDVCVIYTDTPDQFNRRWTILAGNRSSAMSVVEAAEFQGEGDTLEAALANIKENIKP